MGLRRGLVSHTIGAFAALVGLGCALPSESLSKASSELASAEFSFACENATHEDVAFSGSVGLAAWAHGGTVHATRMNPSGAALDAPALELGIPPGPPVFGAWVIGDVRVAPFGAGFMVVVAISRLGQGGLDAVTRSAIFYRVVQADGTLGSWVSVVEPPTPSGGCCQTHADIYDITSNGSVVLLAASDASQYDADLNDIAKPLHVYSLDGSGAALVADVPSTIDASLGSIDPFFYGLGCSGATCLLTYSRPPPTVCSGCPIDSTYEAMILGESPQINGAVLGRGSIVGTPSGFLHVSSWDGFSYIKVARFNLAGVLVSQPVQVWNQLDQVLSVGAIDEPDQSRVQVAWLTIDDPKKLVSGLLGEDGSVLGPATVEDTGLVTMSDHLGLAYAGEGAALVGYQRATPSGRFLGVLPCVIAADTCGGSTTSSSTSSGEGGGMASGSGGASPAANSSSASSASSASTSSGGKTSAASGMGGEPATSSGSSSKSSDDAQGCGCSEGAARTDHWLSWLVLLPLLRRRRSRSSRSVTRG